MATTPVALGCGPSRAFSGCPDDIRHCPWRRLRPRRHRLGPRDDARLAAVGSGHPATAGPSSVLAAVKLYDRKRKRDSRPSSCRRSFRRAHTDARLRVPVLTPDPARCRVGHGPATTRSPVRCRLDLARAVCASLARTHASPGRPDPGPVRPCRADRRGVGTPSSESPSSAARPSPRVTHAVERAAAMLRECVRRATPSSVQDSVDRAPPARVLCSLRDSTAARGRAARQSFPPRRRTKRARRRARRAGVTGGLRPSASGRSSQTRLVVAMYRGDRVVTHSLEIARGITLSTVVPRVRPQGRTRQRRRRRRRDWPR